MGDRSTSSKRGSGEETSKVLGTDRHQYGYDSEDAGRSKSGLQGHGEMMDRDSVQGSAFRLLRRVVRHRLVTMSP